MTRRNPLVLCGEEIKLRLEAERAAYSTPVHIDWLRFTVQRRLSEFPSVDTLFPRQVDISMWDENARKRQFDKLLSELPGGEFEASAQAMELAEEVAEALGPDFVAHPELRKGHDFYKHRFSIERNGEECGWIGFLASSDSPRQRAQSKTLHCNLYGAACTFAAHGWKERMAHIIRHRDGDITRCDLALDFFDGMPGGLDGVKADYMAGVMDVAGKRPKCNMLGDWCNNAERSFYIGSKEAGKQTNVYEKGHQLFGRDSGSLWHRIEVRYGNKLRVLPVDLLTRPADFFAGASEWHALMLAKADAVVQPEPIKTTPRLALETVDAEVCRVIRWVSNTAGAALAFISQHSDPETFCDMVGTTKRPGRLRGFSVAEIGAAASRVMDRFSNVAAAGPGMHPA